MADSYKHTLAFILNHVPGDSQVSSGSSGSSSASWNWSSPDTTPSPASSGSKDYRLYNTPAPFSGQVMATAQPATPATTASGMDTDRYRCPRCLKSIRKRDKTDHRLSHHLDGPLGVPVADGRKCTGCRDKKRRCRVAQMPKHPDTRTVRCHCCVAYKEKCSFVAEYRNARISANDTHPALT